MSLALSNEDNQMNWQDVRDEFPVTKRFAYLDHAAVAPLSARCASAMRAFIADTEERGYVNAAKWDRRVEEVRGLAGQLIGADADEIAFVKNTTEGLCHVANGLPWQERDNVVITDVEFPANVYPWLNVEKRGVEVRRVKEVDGRIPFEAVEASIDARTRVVSLSFVEFLSGFRNDLVRIGELCARRGALFAVDAIQGLGALQLDVREAGIHFLSADGHKWLLSPEGAGIFFCARRALDQLEVSEAGWMAVVDRSNYMDYNFTLKDDATRFECGSLNTLGICGLGGSLELLLNAGIDRVQERVLALTDHLCAGLEAAGCDVFSSRAPGEKSGIVTFTPAHGEVKSLHRRLREAGVICSFRNGKIRVSPHAYNNVDDIDRLLAALPN